MNHSKALRQLNELSEHNSDPRLAAEGWSEDWQILIATLLSARTRDTVTVKVATALFEKYKTLKEISELNLEALEQEIKSVNFYRNKARFVLGCVKGILEHFSEGLPCDASELVKLTGVGRKTANVFIASMGGDAIGVDTHVGRVARKLGWTTHTDPDKVEKDLCELFPQSSWRSVNYILVKFGQSNRGKKEDLILEKIK
ncbi:endonuclease III [Candidatus Woesearchaeota archaeon]|jgi:endonuclease III|nr:endonuclease III [Candidatus Woesearchaeota archaeon]MBT3304781.1 endonuclease III [Candidatus Woesearchaeota archaeon]MBT4367883.1 endonuclease III [Candidatus Woesearchaeota archaeon]MBT4712371.1 endonuclease III [Candidatus Woesearchaeota archaeon]MBT6639283.1 endonuclease III [Candidatus Woesearchaeota archaeon]